MTAPHQAPLPVVFLLAGSLLVGGCGAAGTAIPDPAGDTNVSATGPGRASVATIRNFTPTTGGVGTVVRIDGFGFAATSRVFFSTIDPATGAAGFVAAATTFVSSSRLTAVVPAGAVTGSIKVVTAGSPDAVSPIVFTSTAPPPPPPPPPPVTGPGPGTGGGGTPPTVPAGTGIAADVLPQTGNQMVLASLPAIVQLRANRMRIEVTGDVPPAPASVCTDPAALPSMNAVEALLDPNVPTTIGLRGRAMVVIDPLASPAGATPAQVSAASQQVFSGPGQVTSVVPGLATIDVTDMPTPPDEPGVAVGNDAAGNVLEIVWNPAGMNGFVQAAPIVRIQLADPSLVASTDTLRIIWTLETYDKNNPTTVFTQWWGQAGNIRQ